MKLFSVGVVAKNEEKQEKQARRERERERETSGLVGKRGGPNFSFLFFPQFLATSRAYCKHQPCSFLKKRLTTTLIGLFTKQFYFSERMHSLVDLAFSHKAGTLVWQQSHLSLLLSSVPLSSAHISVCCCSCLRIGLAFGK